MNYAQKNSARREEIRNMEREGRARLTLRARNVRMLFLTPSGLTSHAAAASPSLGGAPQVHLCCSNNRGFACWGRGGGGARLSRVCVWGARDWARTDLHELGLFRGRGLRALHRHSEVRCVSREVEHVLDDRFVRNELLLRVTAFQTESQGASVDSSTVGGFDASCGE